MKKDYVIFKLNIAKHISHRGTPKLWAPPFGKRSITYRVAERTYLRDLWK